MNPKHKISADQIDILPTDPKYLEAAAELQREKDQRKQAEKLANWIEPKPVTKADILSGTLHKSWRDSKKGWWRWADNGSWTLCKHAPTDIAAAHELLEKVPAWELSKYGKKEKRRSCILLSPVGCTVVLIGIGDTSAEAICNAFEKLIDWEKEHEPK